MDVKDILKERRIQLGYSVNELGKRLGVSGSTVSRWETGEIDNMGRSKIAQLSKILGISPAVILELNDEPPVKNLIVPNAKAVPILGRISCGNGTFLEDSFHGEFVLDSSIKADYCLIVSGDSMIDAGIEHGDKVFLKKTYDIHDGKIYGVVLKGEDVATLKMIFLSEDEKHYTLQPCNSSGEYKTICVDTDSVVIAGECVGVYKTL